MCCATLCGHARDNKEHDTGAIHGWRGRVDHEHRRLHAARAEPLGD
jgi:hypothetical protein